MTAASISTLELVPSIGLTINTNDSWDASSYCQCRRSDEVVEGQRRRAITAKRACQRASPTPAPTWCLARHC